MILHHIPKTDESRLQRWINKWKHEERSSYPASWHVQSAPMTYPTQTERHECVDWRWGYRHVESDKSPLALVYLGIYENILNIDHSEHGCTTVAMFKYMELHTANNWIVWRVSYNFLKLFQGSPPTTYVQ